MRAASARAKNQYSLRFLLTFRAEVGRSPPQNDAHNFRSTDLTGLAFPIVHLVAVLKPARFARGIAVIAQGAATKVNGSTQRQLDGAIEAADLAGRQAA